MEVYCHFTLTTEITRAGGVLPSSDFETVRLYTVFESPSIWWLELVVVGFFVWFFIEQVMSARRAGFRAYVTKLSTILANSNVMAYTCMWIFRIMSLSLAPKESDVEVKGNMYV